MLPVASGDDERWRTRAECGWRATLRFSNPDAVYCEGCDRQLGETDRPVESDLVALEDSGIVTEDGETWRLSRGSTTDSRFTRAMP